MTGTLRDGWYGMVKLLPRKLILKDAAVTSILASGSLVL